MRSWLETLFSKPGPSDAYLLAIGIRRSLDDLIVRVAKLEARITAAERKLEFRSKKIDAHLDELYKDFARRVDMLEGPRLAVSPKRSRTKKSS